MNPSSAGGPVASQSGLINAGWHGQWQWDGRQSLHLVSPGLVPHAVIKISLFS